MKRVFISQPMKGRKTEDILEERSLIVDRLEEILGEDIEVINSFYSEYISDKPLYYLGKSLELLSTADVAYFVKGWEYFRGCRIEHLCCQEYDIPYEYLD